MNEKQRKTISDCSKALMDKQRETLIHMASEIGPDRFFEIADEVTQSARSWTSKAEEIGVPGSTEWKMGVVYAFAVYGMLDISERLIDTAEEA